MSQIFFLFRREILRVGELVVLVQFHRAGNGHVLGMLGLAAGKRGRGQNPDHAALVPIRGAVPCSSRTA